MQALQFWRAVALDEANMLEGLVGFLEDHRVAYCVIGGQAVNAYVEPLVSMDLDVVIAVEDLERISPLLAERFKVEVFPHSIDLAPQGSSLRAQIRTDDRYAPFIARSERRDVLGPVLPVASLEDVILEARPELRSHVPGEVLGRLMS